jgi:glycosyltransferase involved in cell wall biosynthesis
MRIAIWTTMYPLPGEMHNGHAVQKLARALRESYPDCEVDVYLFIPAMTPHLLRGISKPHRVLSDALRSGPYEAGLYFKSLAKLPKNMCDRFINPPWQKHVLPRIGSGIKCDLILVHMCDNLSYGAVLTGRQTGIPVVLELQREVNNLDSQPVWKKKLLVRAIKQCNAVCSPSAHLATKCRNATCTDVYLIPSGTDPLFDEEPPSDLQRKRRVLFVGTLDANKGIRALLQASLKLFANGFNFELIVVGGGFYGEGRDRAVLENMAQGHRQVKFLGILSPKQVQLLCVPSYTETFGLVYAEAMKQGLPIIGRRGTGIDGMGKAGVHYELIEKDEELPRLLKALLNNEPRRTKLAAAAQHLAKSWTWKNTALQHMAVFERLINR